MPNVGEWVMDIQIEKIDLSKNRVTLRFADAGKDATAQPQSHRAHDEQQRPQVGSGRWESPERQRPQVGSGRWDSPERQRPQIGSGRWDSPKQSFWTSSKWQGALHADSASEFQVGNHVTGVIKTVTTQGVYIDLGAQKEGWLPCSSGQAFQIGEKVSDLRIDTCDRERNRITLRLTESSTNAEMSWGRRRGIDTETGRAADYEPSSTSSWKGPPAVWTEGGTGGTKGGKD